MVRLSDLVLRKRTKGKPSTLFSDLDIPDKESKDEGLGDIYNEGCSYIESNVRQVAEGEVPDVEPGKHIITKIVDNAQAQDALYFKALYTKDDKDPFVTHLMNVAVYAVKVGVGLGYSRDDLVRLGIAGLLYDLGMVKVPQKVKEKKGKLTPGELERVRSHPEMGYKILSKLGPSYEWVADVALQHHEREDGSGYPKGLRGEEIHEYAKIIGVVDVYEAMTHVRPQRKHFLPFLAVKEIVQTQKGCFAQTIIKGLLTQLSVFPVNSYVKLNNNSLAQVIEITRDEPLRPTVRILFDPQGRRVEEKEVVDLKSAPLLYIVDSLFKEDLPS